MKINISPLNTKGGISEICFNNNFIEKSNTLKIKNQGEL